MARVEWRMTVELRFLPPPNAEKETAQTEDQVTIAQQEYSDLSRTARELKFPKVQGRPVTELPPPLPERKAKTTR